jgi:hypothetical protein
VAGFAGEDLRACTVGGQLLPGFVAVADFKFAGSKIVAGVGSFPGDTHVVVIRRRFESEGNGPQFKSLGHLCTGLP